MEENQADAAVRAAPVPSPLSSPSPSVGPVEQSQRMLTLDALRGFALCGILVMNIASFALIGAAYMNPTAYGDASGANFWTWYVSHLLADQKFMTIFSMLFGAGIVLMTSRVEQRGGSPAKRHYARMGWLILFGVLHAHLLWFGDILFFYGMCGLLVFLFRKLRPSWLFVLGAVALIVPFLVSLLVGWSMQFWPDQAIADTAKGWSPTAAQIASELEAYRGGWVGQLGHRVPMAIAFETFIFAIWGGWRAGGLMLWGMAFFKLGVFSGERSRGFYAALAAIGFAVGIPIVAYGVERNFAADWSLEYAMFFGSQFNYWASLLVSLGWVGLVVLMCKNELLQPIMKPLAAVGQMALTNYLMHTVICTTIFYGHGFGYFGSLDRIEMFGVVAAVWAAQLIYSPIWLHFFRFGPAEWLWRSLSYWELQPFLRPEAFTAVTRRAPSTT